MAAHNICVVSLCLTPYKHGPHLTELFLQSFFLTSFCYKSLVWVILYVPYPEQAVLPNYRASQAARKVILFNVSDEQNGFGNIETENCHNIRAAVQMNHSWSWSR